MTSSINNIAVIGIGVIGTGWIIRFLYNKKKIKVYDPNVEQKKILLTIDDAFTSFYENAWPILKDEKIPFIEPRNWAAPLPGECRSRRRHSLPSLL